jgi:uncharacterized RDD family membrane protein YckC
LSADPARVERIEINLNQPLLPFEEGEKSSAVGRTDQVPAGLKSAPVAPRFIAGIIDALFIFGYFLIFPLIIAFFIPEFAFFSRISLVGLGVVLIMIAAAYIFFFTSFVGKTLGMEHQRLRVINFSRRSPIPKEVALRAFGYLISAGCFGLGFLWALFDAEKMTWHDRISGTLIVTGNSMN